MALLFSPASQSLDPTFGLVLFGALDDDVPYLEYLHRKPCFVGGVIVFVISKEVFCS